MARCHRHARALALSGAGQFSEGGDLPWTQRSSGQPSAARERRCRVPALGRQLDPALIPRTAGRGEQRPVQRDRAAGREGPQASHETGPSLGRGETTRGLRTRRQLIEQIAFDRAETLQRDVARGTLGDELQALEHARRQHRPQDEGGRGEVVGRDPAGEAEAEGRQQRSVGPDAFDDRLGQHAGRDRRGLAQHDPERLAPAEVDEDRLAELEIGKVLRDQVRVGPRTGRAGGVDRDLDEPGRRDVGPVIRLESERGHERSLEADPARRVEPMGLGDDRVDRPGGPVDLAGLVDDDVVVVLLTCQFDGRVALTELELVGGLGRA